MARKKTPAAPASASCVLYDPADGSIVHTHTVVRFDGGRLPSPKDLESEAQAALQKQPHRRSGLQTLHLKPGDLESEDDLRVEAGKLAKVPSRPRPSKR